MEKENEQVLNTTTQEEEIVLEEETAEEVVTLPKSEFTKMKRKAIAYDSDKGKPKEVISNKEYSLNDEVVDLRLDGYTKQDVDFIMKNGGRKALEDKTSYTAIAINARKEQAKAEAEANKVQDTSGMTEVERKYTPEMMKNMTVAELKKILPHA